MTIQIKAPTFPESVADGTIANWLKNEGDIVKQDEIIAEIETDKVVLEVVAPNDGKLLKVIKAEGDIVLSAETIGEFDDSVEVSVKKDTNNTKLTSDKVTEEAITKKTGPAAKKLISENNLNKSEIKSSEISTVEILISSNWEAYLGDESRLNIVGFDPQVWKFSPSTIVFSLTVVSLAICFPPWCAIEEDRNQIPNIKATIFLGESFVTSESPTGERTNSPIVCKRYNSIKKKAGIMPATAEPCPNLRTKKPRPKRIRPTPNLYGAEGSFPELESFIHIHENIGAKAIINKGLIDWKKVVLISKPRTLLLIFLAVNKFKAEPASSKNVQKIVVNNNRISITHILCLAVTSILLA